jgi:hypothetical protein
MAISASGLARLTKKIDSLVRCRVLRARRTGGVGSKLVSGWLENIVRKKVFVQFENVPITQYRADKIASRCALRKKSNLTSSSFLKIQQLCNFRRVCQTARTSPRTPLAKKL